VAILRATLLLLAALAGALACGMLLMRGEPPRPDVDGHPVGDSRAMAGPLLRGGDAEEVRHASGGTESVTSVPPLPAPPGRVSVIVVDHAQPEHHLRDAIVYLLPATLDGADNISDITREARTDASGAASLLSTGRYSLGVRAEGYLPFVRGVELHGGTTINLTASLDPGLSLSGTVCDELSGEPVKNARVDFKRVDDEETRVWDFPGITGTPRIWDVCHADPENAQFVISGLPPGTYALTAKAIANYADGATMRFTAPASGIALMLAPSGLIRVQVDNWKDTGGHVLSARAFDEVTGRLANSVTQRTADGEAEIGSRIPVGDYGVEVESDSGFYGRARVHVASPGQTIDVRTTLQPEPTIEFALVGGDPLDGWLSSTSKTGLVFLLPLKGRGVTVRRPPGWYRLRYVNRNSLSNTVEVELHPGDHASVVFINLRPKVIRVVAATGSWAVIGSAGARREVFQFRGESLLHIGDECALQDGDEVLVDAPAGALLTCLSQPSLNYALGEGMAYELTASGLHGLD
jgi:hypothetical protein